MAINKKIDLHAHTTASDGTFSPAMLVSYAKEKELAVLAITDHDSFLGVSEAVQAGEQEGVIIVPGIELSTTADGHSIHVLGYFTNNADLVWQERVAKLIDARDSRNMKMINKLNELGIQITLEEVKAVVSGEDTTIGRPHIAQVLINKGVVSSKQEAFERFLAKGKAAYVSTEKVHPTDAYRWIREAGGICVLAHPGIYGAPELVEQLLAAGPDGVEVYHADHTPEQIAWLKQRAEHYGLLQTGGSDFHGLAGEKVEVHGDLGCSNVPYELYESLIAFRKSRTL